MRITEVRTIVTCPGRNYVLVKVMTDEGVYGVGDGTLNGSELAVAQAIRHAGELLVGRDPARIEDAWQLLYRWSYWRGGPVFTAALGALDLALWDIKGKVAGLPVYQLLGGRCRDGAMCYGHADGGTPEEVAEGVHRFRERGYRVVRVQQGGYGGPGMRRGPRGGLAAFGRGGAAFDATDASGEGAQPHDPPARGGIPATTYFDVSAYLATTPLLFEHLRKVFDLSVELCHDVHEQLLPDQARWLLRRLEPYRPFFVEDPLRPEHQESFRLVREASGCSIAMGELFTSRWECLPLLQHQWIDYLRVAPIHVGGISEARKICALAETFQVRTAFHGAADIGPIGQAAALHLDVAVPNFGIQEWVDFTSDERISAVMPVPCRFEDGFAFPHEKPGLGVDIDETEAAKFPYRPAYMPIVRRVDGSMHLY